MKKTCGICKEEKDISAFSKANNKKCGYQSKCKECQKEYHKGHYLRNKDKYIEKAKVRRLELSEWWRSYKSTLTCNRCPESHVACLHFHHTDPSEKEGNISSKLNHWSKERIMKEVAKCEVLCANCHAKEHFKIVQ